MSLNIKDPLTETAVRQLAALTGEGVTMTVRRAAQERLARLQRERSRGTLAAELLDLGAHCASLPDFDVRPPEEILGYDENGLPA